MDNNFCKLCALTFAEKSMFEFHMSIHLSIAKEKRQKNQSVPEKNYSNICQESKKKDKEEKLCSICNISFSKKDSFTKHTSSVHDGKKYNCSICKATFSEKSSVKVHIDQFMKNISNVTCVMLTLEQKVI